MSWKSKQIMEGLKMTKQEYQERIAKVEEKIVKNRGI